LVTSGAGTAFSNTILNDRKKGWEDEVEDASSYWVKLRKRENFGN
jgi:hypothetical protein